MGWRESVDSKYQNIESLIREQPKKKSWLDTVAEAFTGSERETAATENLPEGVDIPFEFSGRQAKAALGTLFTFDPNREMSILLENYPDLQFGQDEKGNILVDSSAYGGGLSVLNKPGMSLEDIMKMGGVVGAFTPAGRAAMGGSLLGGVARGAIASGATQAGLDIATQALGGVGEGEQEGVQLSDVNLTDVGLAALGGGIGELGARGLSKAFQFFRKAQPMPLDDATKQAVLNVEKQVDQYLKDTGEIMSKQQVIDLFRQNNISDEIAQHLAADIPNEFRPATYIAPDPNIPDVRNATTQIQNIASEGAPRLSKNLAEASAKEAELAANQSLRYRIPYSESQRSGSVAGKQFEEQALGGALGQEAQRSGLQLKAAQEAAIPQAVRTEAQMMTNQPLVASSVDAAEALAGRVGSIAEAEYRAVQEAYSAVPKGSFYKPDAIKGVIRSMRKSMIGAEFDKTLPKTSQALSDTAKMEKVMTLLEKKNARFPFEHVENYRRKLNGYIKGADNPTDQRQLIIMRDTMDDYLNQAVADGLLHGDDGALEAIKNARSLRRAYSEKFEPQVLKARSGVKQADPAGVLINKMAELDPDAGDVSRALFGSGNLLGRSGSAKFATRIKDVVGESSPEWQQVRQAAFLKIFGMDKGQLTQSAKEGVYISGADALNKLQDVIGGNNKELGKVLFSKEEISSMTNLARAIKRAQPAPFNPSGTSPAVNKTINELGEKMMRMMAFDNIVSGAIFNAVGKGSAAISEKQASNLAAQVFSGRPLQRYVANANAATAGAVLPSSAVQLRSREPSIPESR